MPSARTVLVAIAGAFALVLSRNAQAEGEERSWHQGPHAMESPQHYALEFRFGPYKPQIDDGFSGVKPYSSVFGNTPTFFFGGEFDWQALRIPSVGTIGPGIGLGYTRASTVAKIRGTDSPSAENTYLSILPIYATAVLRVDVFARQIGIPVVPYGKLGIGCGLFWMGNDRATQAQGHTWGMHYALGGMLLLDSIDNQAAMQLDNEFGINNSYLFFEWVVSNLDGFASSSDPSVLRIGTNSWVAGLAFEM